MCCSSNVLFKQCAVHSDFLNICSSTATRDLFNKYRVGFLGNKRPEREAVHLPSSSARL